jgi:hypothetical protein
VLVSVLMLCAGLSAAQVMNSGAATIALNANLSESVSLNLSANAVNFTLAAGSANNPGSTSITATTTWTLKPSRGNLNVYAFFTNSAAALTDGAGNNIPSSDFQISDNGGAFTALTNTVPFGGANAGLQIATVKIIGNNKQGTRTDTMNFNINLAPLPNLPAGTYTGTVTIQVQVI